MALIKLTAFVLLVLLLLWSGLMAYLSCTAPLPDVRLVEGQLRPCPGTPNCVSSESNHPDSRIEPLRFKGDAGKAWADLQAVIRSAGGTIAEEREGFLWATFTSRVFRFVDDVECRLVVEEGVIHLRSGARVGKSDMGVNRERMARLRLLFEQRQGVR